MKIKQQHQRKYCKLNNKIKHYLLFLLLAPQFRQTNCMTWVDMKKFYLDKNHKEINKY